MKDYNLSFEEIESMPLEILLDLEVVDSKIDAAFEEKSAREASRRKVGNKKSPSPKHKPFSGGVAYIDQIMNF